MPYFFHTGAMNMLCLTYLQQPNLPKNIVVAFGFVHWLADNYHRSCGTEVECGLTGL